MENTQGGFRFTSRIDLKETSLFLLQNAIKKTAIANFNLPSISILTFGAF